MFYKDFVLVTFLYQNISLSWEKKKVACEGKLVREASPLG